VKSYFPYWSPLPPNPLAFAKLHHIIIRDVNGDVRPRHYPLFILGKASRHPFNWGLLEPANHPVRCSRPVNLPRLWRNQTLATRPLADRTRKADICRMIPKRILKTTHYFFMPVVRYNLAQTTPQIWFKFGMRDLRNFVEPFRFIFNLATLRIFLFKSPNYILLRQYFSPSF
jgi:hypothetical protein